MTTPLPSSPVPNPAAVAESKKTIGEWLETKDFEKAPWLRRWFWFALGGGVILLIVIMAVVLSSGSPAQAYPIYTQMPSSTPMAPMTPMSAMSQ